ncbi:acetyl-CoA carboxylase carboxyltransferase subunit alpha [Moraxella sp. FZLJ2107]|uniref:acetyl-CoA carboxylase carboxyltransferase subunit alpha n=1 Tax=unclassified Moraxella TaxID=2685852 RepID=UPI0020C838AB|nr:MULTISPECIES: acetyl-CoA carboxylase carboxyltransferase subunit alpha [unclassified Moraxella]UTO04683.1 acetyl-CoA carboxylase carboxyltransferase subunit alpha [Moraxella sp. FZLJ2107]UTO21411.1 acetyl-CoA carboxylase carboxyltransferase subunit alpha [Moraxella sp. FZLJ2109]
MNTVWESVQLARHAKRPLFLDYVDALFTEFDELHGDRAFADDRAIIGGLARFNGQPVMVVGQHRGRSTRERIAHNFGMANPEGYRKIIRLVQMAERFGLPVFTFIDTQGAYPGVGAEERGQAEAIAKSIAVFSSLGTPVIATVIGEGGSGGALAIGVADRVNMLENSIYSVISPEGCASILWKTAEKAPAASEALKLNAVNLHQLGLIDEVIAEGVGAHEAPEPVMTALKELLTTQLAELEQLPKDELLQRRYDRLMQYNSKVSL